MMIVLEISSTLNKCNLFGGALKIKVVYCQKSLSLEDELFVCMLHTVTLKTCQRFSRYQQLDFQWKRPLMQLHFSFVAGRVHRYFHVLLSLNTFRSRNVQCWGFCTAVRGLWHTAGLNVHQTPFCFVLPPLLFIYSQSLILCSCFFIAQSAVYPLHFANSAITCSTEGPGFSRSVPIFC